MTVLHCTRSHLTVTLCVISDSCEMHLCEAGALSEGREPVAVMCRGLAAGLQAACVVPLLLCLPVLKPS